MECLRALISLLCLAYALKLICMMKIATFLFVALISPVNPRPPLSACLLVVNTQMCLIGISNITCPWNPSRVLRGVCFTGWSFLGDPFWETASCGDRTRMCGQKGGGKNGRLGAKLPCWLLESCQSYYCWEALMFSEGGSERGVGCGEELWKR